MSAKVSTKDLRLSAEPRVQLLPPLVKQRAQSLRARRLAIFAIVVAIGVAVGGTAYSYLRSVQATGSLEAARALTGQILAEQSQYSEATQVAALIVDTEQARRDVTTNEVDWLDLVTGVGGLVPAGASISTIAMQAPAPWEATLVPEGELRPARVAVVQVTLLAPDYASASAFVTALYGMEGVADAFISGTAAETAGYLTTITITFDEGIRIARFTEEETVTEEAEPETIEAEGETVQAVGETVGEVAP